VSIEPGDRVGLEYVGRFEDGSVFATSSYEVATEHGLEEAQNKTEDEFTPLSFTVGAGEVIEGIDEAVRGMSVDDEKTVSVPPEKAYGEYHDDRLREYDRETFEGMVGQPPEIGFHVEAKNELHGDVVAITDDSVQVDFNHELAGKTLVFDIRVLAVE
jgi:peptidyl-prolyl cis-trans isomerase B (cyclophilin B)